MLRRRILSAYVVNSLFVILVSVAALFSGSEAALGQCTDSETQNRIRKVLDARSRLRAKTYAALFDGCPLETVGSLKTHSNSGVAIRAAWEEVDRCFQDCETPRVQWAKTAFQPFAVSSLGDFKFVRRHGGNTKSLRGTESRRHMPRRWVSTSCIQPRPADLHAKKYPADTG